MKRRTFLRTTAMAGAALPMLGGVSSLRAHADRLGVSPFARAAVPGDRVLVILRLDGGADGLNTLVPIHDEEYYRARRRGLSNDITIHPERCVPIAGSSTLALHPLLAPLAPLFEEGKVAVVQNVGYENTVMSHFRSTEIWMSASDAGQFVATGWLARAHEQAQREYPGIGDEAPYAIEFATRMSTAFIGTHGDLGMAYTGIGYIPDEPEPRSSSGARALAERRHIETVMGRTNRYSHAIVAARDRVRANRVEYPTIELEDGNRFSANLAETARLIASGLATQVYLVTLPFYDFHIRQTPRENAQHDAFARSVIAFQRDLEAFGVAHRVSIVTISEFGRRVDSTGSGTDHGGAAPLMAIGENVAGGFIGSDPDLHDLVGPGNLRARYDFRQVYASVLGQWLGVDDATISGALLGRGFEQLPIFRPRSIGSAVEGAPPLLGEPWPNPARGSVTMAVGMVRSSPATLRLHTTDGRLVRSVAVWPGSGRVRLDLSGLPAGQYLCELVDGNARETRRLVVIAP